MPFPDGWPPRFPSGQRNIRFYVEDTATVAFDDKAYLFADQAAANPYTPLPNVRPGEDVSAPDYNGPHDIGANPAGTGQRGDDPHPMIWSEHILIENKDVALTLEISFDGVNVHGVVPPSSIVVYDKRREAGIAVRGNTIDYRIEAW